MGMSRTLAKVRPRIVGGAVWLQCGGDCTVWCVGDGYCAPQVHVSSRCMLFQYGCALRVAAGRQEEVFSIFFLAQCFLFGSVFSF